MSIQNRVEKLEGATGAGSETCACRPLGTDVRYYDSKALAEYDKGTGEVCGACCRPKCIIKVVHVDRSRDLWNRRPSV